jgi:hypothetical protein
MKTLLKIEEFFLLGFAIFLFSQLGMSWWLFALLFLAPDLSMVGYLSNPRVGSWTYNLVHHKGTAVTLYVLGYLTTTPWLMFTGTLLLAHSSFDRVFGYGLKYPDSFHATHLGVIGNPDNAQGE